MLPATHAAATPGRAARSAELPRLRELGERLRLQAALVAAGEDSPLAQLAERAGELAAQP